MIHIYYSVVQSQKTVTAYVPVSGYCLMAPHSSVNDMLFFVPRPKHSVIETCI